MARPLQVRQPTQVEMRKLQGLLESTDPAGRRRRAEVLLLYGAGLTGTAIASTLVIHPDTAYADLHSFAREGLDCLRPGPRRGPKPEITPEQIAQMQALAETPPYTLGLPHGHWSLATLGDYLTQPPQRLVKHLSLEHLRQLQEREHSPPSSSTQDCQPGPAATCDFGSHSSGLATPSAPRRAAVLRC